MTSSVVQHITQPLDALRDQPQLLSSCATDLLQELLLFTRGSSSQNLEGLQDALNALCQFESSSSSALYAAGNSADRLLKSAIIGNLVIGAYSQTLELHLREASELETEAEWWSYIERSTYKTAYYLFQTLPERTLRVIRVCGEHLRAQGIPIRLSSYHPRLLRQLFTESGQEGSNPLATALFPHLETHPPSAKLLTMAALQRKGFKPKSILQLGHSLLAFALLPISLARQECHLKRKELERLRDNRSEVLGALIQMREALSNTLQRNINEQDFLAFIGVLEQTSGLTDAPKQASELSSNVLDRLHLLLQDTLPGHQRSHELILEKHALKRPSFWTRSWPRVLLLPPALLYSLTSLYASRASILHAAQDSGETLRMFFRSWLLEPLRDIVQTVRAGREQGVIIQREAIEADLASLERMIVALAKDTLKWGPEQLQSLSHQVRVGDLTPVLEIYENDIKSPLRSAVSGTLLRSVFIQVQKAKVN
jgi:nuclear-control-of-ATPase protein 2